MLQLQNMEVRKTNISATQMLKILLVMLIAVLVFLYFKNTNQPQKYTPTTPDEIKANNALKTLVGENKGERIIVETTKKNYTPYQYMDSIDSDFESKSRCAVSFNTEYPANQKINYTDERFNLNIQLPFNESWGGNYFKVPPFEKEEGGTGSGVVLFGPLQTDSYGYCTWNRRYRMRYGPYYTLDEYIENFGPDAPATQYFDMQDYGANKMIVQKSNSTKECQLWHVVVFTRDEVEVFDLSNSCDDVPSNSIQDLKILLETAKTIQSLKNS